MKKILFLCAILSCLSIVPSASSSSKDDFLRGQAAAAARGGFLSPYDIIDAIEASLEASTSSSTGAVASATRQPPSVSSGQASAKQASWADQTAALAKTNSAINSFFNRQDEAEKLELQRHQEAENARILAENARIAAQELAFLLHNKKKPKNDIGQLIIKEEKAREELRDESNKLLNEIFFRASLCDDLRRAEISRRVRENIQKDREEFEKAKAEQDRAAQVHKKLQ